MQHRLPFPPPGSREPGVPGKKKSPESPDSKEALVVRPLSYARINVVRFKGFDLSPKAPPAIPNSYAVVETETTRAGEAPQRAKRNRPQRRFIH